MIPFRWENQSDGCSASSPRRRFRRSVQEGRSTRGAYRSAIASFCFQAPASSCVHSLANFDDLTSLPFVTMSGCGNANCKCGANCTCGSSCSCGRNMTEPTFGGLRNYNAENDCKCGPNCSCVDCQCHK